MNIIKRSGKEMLFDISKIKTAIDKANREVSAAKQLSSAQIQEIAAKVEEDCISLNRAPSVEEIQDMVENHLMDSDHHDVARKYITYRYKRTMIRENTTDGQILALLNHENEDAKQENSNKNPLIVSVERDYIAGITSKDITERYLLTPKIAEAHQSGIIHFHDADYFVQPLHNCCLVNLEDMLNNGTNISGTHIDTPRSITTAATVTSQIIAQVASSQFGLRLPNQNGINAHKRVMLQAA